MRHQGNRTNLEAYRCVCGCWHIGHGDPKISSVFKHKRPDPLEMREDVL